MAVDAATSSTSETPDPTAAPSDDKATNAPVTSTPQATARPLTPARDDAAPSASPERTALAPSPTTASAPQETTRVEKAEPASPSPSVRAQHVLDAVKTHVQSTERSAQLDIGHGDSRVRATIHIEDHRVIVRLATADVELRGRLQTGLAGLARDLERRGFVLDRATTITGAAPERTSGSLTSRAVSHTGEARAGAQGGDPNERGREPTRRSEDDDEPAGPQPKRRTNAGRAYLG